MPPAVVHLHIGSPKTGTTYLQNSLWHNRDAIAASGILLPGRSRAHSAKAVSEMLQWRGDGASPSAWRRLCHEIAAWDGPSVVVSHEHLNKTTAVQWEAVADTLGPARLEIVLTARDLARSVPAQWQSSVRQRYSWTLDEYADAVAAPDARTATTGPARHFWRRQDTPEILHRFVERTSLDQVRLVTVPPSGGDPDELWRRFCRATDIDMAATEPGEVSHESLGAASAEVMRRLNASDPAQAMTVAAYKKGVNHALSRNSLAARRGAEPGLTLPDRLHDWAQAEASQLVEAVAATGVTVVGDLDDLRPRPSSKPFVSPDSIPDAELLEAAIAGLGAMAQQHADLRSRLDEALRVASAPDVPVAPPVATPAPDRPRRLFGRGS